MVKDVLIVGCGPTGMYGWKLASEMGLTGMVVEANLEHGGQTMATYREKLISNIPGLPALKGSKFIEQLWDSIDHKNKDWEMHLNTQVISIDKIKSEEEKYDQWFEVTFSNGKKQQFKFVILSEGMGVYTPMRLVEEEYINVHHIVENLKDYQGKHIVIFGGGDSAVDWANEIAPIAKSISLVHRRNEFRANQKNIQKAQFQGVEIITPFQFESFGEIKDSKINKVFLSNSEDESIKKELDCNVVLVQFGQKITLNKMTGVEIERNKLNRILVKQNMETNISGIYAAGDSVFYESKVRNLLFGFQEIVIATTSIEKIVHDRKVLNNGWTL